MADGYESWFQTLLATRHDALTMTTVVHHPAAHPFVDEPLAVDRRRGSRADGVGRRPRSAPADVRLVHLHFGFEHRDRPTTSRRWVGALRARRASPSSTPSTTSTTPTSSTQAEFHRTVAVLVRRGRRGDDVHRRPPRRSIEPRYRTGSHGRHPAPPRRAVRRHDAARRRRDRRHGDLRARRSTGRPNLDVDAIAASVAPTGRRPVRVHVRPQRAARRRTTPCERLARAGRLQLDVRPRLDGRRAVGAARRRRAARPAVPVGHPLGAAGGGPRPRHAGAGAGVRRLPRPGRPHVRRRPGTEVDDAIGQRDRPSPSRPVDDISATPAPSTRPCYRRRRSRSAWR